MKAGFHCLYFTQCYCFWIWFKRWRYAISYTRNRRMRWHGDTEYLISQGMSNLNGNTCEVRKRISLYKNLLYQLCSSFTSAIRICNSAWMQLYNKVKCFTFLCGWPLFTSPFVLKRNKKIHFQLCVCSFGMQFWTCVGLVFSQEYIAWLKHHLHSMI